MGMADKKFDSKGGDRKMSQSGVDLGEKGETGEKIPAKASNIDKTRYEGIKGGVGMGNQDRPRNQSEVMESIHTDTGSKGDGNAYHHQREYGKERY
jgi:hypothetical protein